MKWFTKAHPAVTYFAVTFAISWGGVFLVVGPGGFPGTQQQFETLLPFAVLAMLAGPSVAGILLTGLVHGRAGFRELLSRLITWRVGARWYAVALLITPLVFAAVQLTLSLISPVFLPAVLTTGDKASLLLFGVGAALVVGFFEELGWTGFAVPALRCRYGVPATGLIVGVVWGAWHVLTNDIWASGSSLGAGRLSLGLFMFARGIGLLVGQLPAFRVLMVLVYEQTGSLLVAMLMHASLAACTFVVGPAAISGVALLTSDLASSAAMWVVAAAVVVANTRRRGRETLDERAAGEKRAHVPISAAL